MGKILSGFDGYLMLGATAYGDDITAGHASKAAIQVIVANTGSAAGKIKIQASLNQTNWCDVYFVDSTGTIVDGYALADGYNLNHMFDISDLGASWLRVAWIRTSGTGGLTYYVNTKKA